jgi:sulfite reductase alpha subunit-like flavoprotein
MRKFWRLLLRKSLPPSTLAGLHYAVFGLGDSGYVKFNVRQAGGKVIAHTELTSHLPTSELTPAHLLLLVVSLSQVAAKKLDRRLAALGATALLERGLGDDQVCPCAGTTLAESAT